MFFDNLTIAGLVAVSFYALLPLLFGKEILRVEEDAETPATQGYHPGRKERPDPAGCGADPAGGLNPATPGG
jgi:hypothetical protein